MPKRVRWLQKQPDKTTPRQQGAVTVEEDCLADVWIAKGLCEEVKPEQKSTEPPAEHRAESKSVEAPVLDRSTSKRTTFRR